MIVRTSIYIETAPRSPCRWSEPGQRSSVRHADQLPPVGQRQNYYRPAAARQRHAAAGPLHPEVASSLIPPVVAKPGHRLLGHRAGRGRCHTQAWPMDACATATSSRIKVETSELGSPVALRGETFPAFRHEGRETFLIKPKAPSTGRINDRSHPR